MCKKFAEYLYYCSIILLLFLPVSCNTNATVKTVEDPETPSPPASDTSAIPRVKLMQLKRTVFDRELVTNGKMAAEVKAVLKFKFDGIIDTIYVKEGSRVLKGQVLAQLDNKHYGRIIEQRKIQVMKALLDYEDILIRMGYDVKDTGRLSPNILKMAKLRSGLSQAYYDLREAEEQYSLATVTAPFPGLVANMEASMYNAGANSQAFCTLINDEKLIVTFPLLESELAFVKKNRQIKVTLFDNSQECFPGVIESINPIIDANGMITIKAKVNNAKGTLLDGMNVRVVLAEKINNQLTVPKMAVLDRQGRKVVYTYENGLAKWNYVDIGMENSAYYTITSGLKPDDRVIYEGDFNLAHDKHVKPVN